MTPHAERRLLQGAVALACLVPLGAGGAGVLAGLGFVDAQGPVSADSHLRYLSGLLLGIGLAFAAAIPRIEQATARVRLLTFIVFVGGLARAWGAFVLGWPSGGMLFGLAMELVVTPAICLWQGRLAARVSRASQ